MTADRTARRLSPWLAGTAVALQITYPLVTGSLRDAVTVLVVLTLATACAAHARESRGPGAVATLVAVAAFGLLIEAVGVRTGLPFGDYAYSDSLGPRVLGVPLVVAAAWPMLAWPAAIAARHLVRGYAARVAVGAWALAAADLFLDPQQVAAGHWRWTSVGPHLPGVGDVPLSNYAGWLLVSLAISAVLQRTVGPSADDRVAIRLYLWLWAGWTVALAVFLDLPAAAGWGALGMGVIAVPLALRLRGRASGVPRVNVQPDPAGTGRR